jgi:hypothetical protein
MRNEKVEGRAEALGLVLGLVLASSLMAAPGGDDRLRPAITVRVVDFAAMPGRTLPQAENVAARILSKAGVDIHWLDCSVADVEPSGCSQTPGLADLFLRIVISIPHQMSGDALGIAALDAVGGTGQYATVYYGRGENVAETSQADAFPILGAAMAHEIGHLLLGARHSPKGVMCGHWHWEELQRLSKGALLFTLEQGEDLRAEINRRMASVDAYHSR